MEAAKAKGAQVIIGTAAGVEFHASSSTSTSSSYSEGGGGQEGGALRAVAGVRVEGRADPIPCDKVVVAMGCVRALFFVFFWECGRPACLPADPKPRLIFFALPAGQLIEPHTPHIHTHTLSLFLTTIPFYT